jgi:hypothetical protein
MRYLKRTIHNSADRAGHLDGAKDSVKWEMIDWVLFKSPKNVAKYAQMIQQSNIPSVTCHSTKRLNAAYKYWNL